MSQLFSLFLPFILLSLIFSFEASSEVRSFPHRKGKAEEKIKSRPAGKLEARSCEPYTVQWIMRNSTVNSGLRPGTGNVCAPPLNEPPGIFCAQTGTGETSRPGVLWRHLCKVVNGNLKEAWTIGKAEGSENYCGYRWRGGSISPGNRVAFPFEFPVIHRRLAECYQKLEKGLIDSCSTERCDIPRPLEEDAVKFLESKNSDSDEYEKIVTIRWNYSSDPQSPVAFRLALQSDEIDCAIDSILPEMNGPGWRFDLPLRPGFYQFTLTPIRRCEGENSKIGAPITISRRITRTARLQDPLKPHAAEK